MSKCSHSCKYTQVLETAVGNSAGDKKCSSSAGQELSTHSQPFCSPSKHWIKESINACCWYHICIYTTHYIYIYISIGWRTSKIPIKSRESEITGHRSDLSPYGKPLYEQCRIWPGGSDFVSQPIYCIYIYTDSCSRFKLSLFRINRFMNYFSFF
jgi:hypothetical protein